MGPFVKRSIFVGYDRREAVAFSVAMGSAGRHLSEFVPLHGLFLDYLIDKGLYRRPLEYREGVMWDVISDAPMATQHANARWLTPHLAKEGWALFMDGDMLVRGDLSKVFDGLDPEKAVYCVKHVHEPPPGVKMDGQLQTRYARKNWSSFVIFNCDHPANQALTLDLINTAPGRDLHRFCWLPDDLIGELPPEYNFLVGHSDPAIDPICVHFTDGTPDMPGYEGCAWAAEWRAEVARRAA
jgi:hypothetical protein